MLKKLRSGKVRSLYLFNRIAMYTQWKLCEMKYSLKKIKLAIFHLLRSTLNFRDVMKGPIRLGPSSDISLLH